MARDFYAILGVPKSASADDIKKAFRKAAQAVMDAHEAQTASRVLQDEA